MKRFNHRLEGYRHHACKDSHELEGEIKRRGKLLPLSQVSTPEKVVDEEIHGAAELWKGLTEGFLREAYRLSEAIVSINQHYFDGLESLFPEVAQGFDQVETGVWLKIWNTGTGCFRSPFRKIRTPHHHRHGRPD